MPILKLIAVFTYIGLMWMMIYNVFQSRGLLVAAAFSITLSLLTKWLAGKLVRRLKVKASIRKATHK